MAKPSAYPKSYRVIANDTDPEIKLQLAPDFLKALMKRSKENGRQIEVDIALRLARSLDDVDILESDLALVQEKRLKEAEKRASKSKKTPISQPTNKTHQKK
jgi:hypothetical protein